MAHRVNISVSVPNDLYEDVILPAKNNHVLAELVCSCLELYSRSTPVKEYVDTGAQAKADSEWDNVLDSLNAAVGALDNDVSFLGDNLEAGKNKVAESAGGGAGEGSSAGIDGASSRELRKVAEKVDSLEDGFGSLKSMLEDVLGYVKGMSEVDKQGNGAKGAKGAKGSVANQAAGKSFEIEDDSVEAVPAEDHRGGESQVSGYSVVQDLKPGSANTRNYDTEEEPEEQHKNPVSINPETAPLIHEMADSLGADMFI